MVFKSLQHLLGTLDSQESWRSRRQFQQLLNHWFEIVGPAVAAQTRPVGIQRRVLQVATANAVWAQNLVFERHRILEKLNAQLGLEITDIKFSTAQWQVTRSPTSADALAALWQDHPSRLTNGTSQTLKTKPAAKSEPVDRQIDSTEAFQNWATQMKARSRQLPLCPMCKCPAPPGELDRWSVCSLCVVKQW